MHLLKFYNIILIVMSIFKISCIETLPQSFDRTLFNQRDGAYQPSHLRQGSIDEFLALRPSAQKPIGHQPCIPQQFYPRTKRSPHHKRKQFYPVYPAVYPVNVYEQNINNIVPVVNSAKPPYNSHGGYYCGNQIPPRPIQQPAHNNLWSHFSNIFGGFLGTNTNVVAAPPPVDQLTDVRPVDENPPDTASNGANQWRPGTPVGGIQNIVNGYHQDLSNNNRPTRFF